VNIRCKKNTCGSGSQLTLFFSADPIIFSTRLTVQPYFLQVVAGCSYSGLLIQRAAHTACQNGVCCHTNYWTKLSKFVHRKYASLVNIDVWTVLQIAQQKNAKTMKKYSKKIYFRPTDPNFFTIWNRNHRYFFYALLWYTYHTHIVC
jgi:hypothetical protein